MSCVAPHAKHTQAVTCQQVLPPLSTKWGALPTFMATAEEGSGSHQPGAVSACSTGLMLGSCKGGWEGWQVGPSGSKQMSVTMAREQVP